jgi:hypothetical protein
MVQIILELTHVMNMMYSKGKEEAISKLCNDCSKSQHNT